MAFKGQPGGHHEPYWDLIKRIITESDVVLEILDARLIELSKNEEVERLIKEIGRPIIYVINKCDLVSKEKIQEKIDELKNTGEAVFISAKNMEAIKILLYKIKKVFREHGKREIEIKKKHSPKPKYREARADIVVGVLGYPNVGKSSIINALCHKKKTQVSKKPGTTRGIHWIRLNNEIKLIDSPGVIPLKKDDEIRYGLMGARASEALNNPDLVAYSLIKLFYKSNKEGFERIYGVELNEEMKSDPEICLEKIAEKRNFLLKGAKPDTDRASRLIVKDWQEGKLRL